MTPRVDVLLATHCRPHTVAYAIESVLAQSLGDFTLHVVGDGSTEATEQAVRAFKDARVRFEFFPKAPGYGYGNRNQVLARTQAPFVAYMTDDDLWFPDHLERGLAALEEGDLDLVSFASCQVRFPDRLDPHFFAFDWRLPGLSAFLRNWFMGAVAAVHRRGVFDRVGYWNDRLTRFGDREFYNRVRRSPLRTTFVDLFTVLRFYAQHWDPRYAETEGPPQALWLPRLKDPAFCAAVRDAHRPGPRSLEVRAAQLSDFSAFALRSGPKLVRFVWQMAASGRGAGPPA